MWDTLIVGAGPGGCSAAIWSHRLGLKTLLLDARDRIGGQLNELHGAVLDYPGLLVDKGYELAPHFARHIQALDIPVRLNTQIVEVLAEKRQLALSAGESLNAKALILATGATRRRLNIPGESRLWGKGVSDSPTREIDKATGRKVAIVGGGDAALENALFLAEKCPEVHLVHRRDFFRARLEFQERIEQEARIIVHKNTLVEEMLGEENLTGIRVRQNGISSILECEMLFIKIGVSPCTSLFSGELELDIDGYLVTDDRQETSARGVYAVGDVCNPVFSSIAHAVGQGMVAAKAIEGAIRGNGL